MYERIIGTDPDKKGVIKLVSTNPQDHVNVVVQIGANTHGAIVLYSDEVKQLRDHLLELFPVPVEAVNDKPYETEEIHNGIYAVYREKKDTVKDILTVSSSKENAVKICRALNEAEGL